MLETIETQQQQFAELPDQLQLDPSIPLTFTKVRSLYGSLYNVYRVVVIHFQIKSLYNVRITEFISDQKLK